MTIMQALRHASQRLADAGVPDAAYDASQMLAHLLGENALAMRLSGERTLPPQTLSAYEALVERRRAREPMQYILGETGFMGLTFHVEPGVLIPRQDTEILCEAALERLSDGKRVLDIGTGSGALAVSLKALCPGCDVTAVDVSETALTIARENARRNGVQVRFLRSDCFGALAGERFDMIVSNPPYISQEEMLQLMPEVRQEPELALFGGEDGLSFYRRIAQEAPAYLNEGGWLLFEIGWKQRDAVQALLSAHIGAPFALKDYGHNWRVVGAQWRGHGKDI